jgi:hypothetical protein
MMAKLSLDSLIHTFYFSIEVNIELIPLDISPIVRFHRDVMAPKISSSYLKFIVIVD